MTAQTLFYLIIGIIVLDFLIEKIIAALNAKHFNDPPPTELEDVYDEEAYRKSQDYKKERFRFSLVVSSFSMFVLLLFLMLDGFAYVDRFARSISDNPIAIALIFFGIMGLAGNLLMLPFSYYSTFVIEEKYGFNKSTKKLFFTDKLKSLGLSVIVGGGLLALLVWLYQLWGDNFWWYAWIAITLFSIVTNLFYAKLIVPLFNKQTPLPENSLRKKIENYAEKVGFELDNVFVIDSSKRTTKANAYFSGFGKEKRITLFDTLIDELEEDEIVAVLAHEVGHYKKNHIIVNIAASVVTTGFTLWLLSIFVDNPLLSRALGVEESGFHIGLVAFGILYSPVSEVTGLIMNYLSRKFEYQADRFAKKTFDENALISALKKLARTSYSNLTPHKAYVFMNYSHPPLLERYKNLKEG